MTDLENGNEVRKVLPTNLSRTSYDLERNNITISESNNDRCCLDCVVLFTTIILCLGLIGGAIAYIVFGIKYLIEDYEEAHDCKGSSLWEYVLVGVVLFVFDLFGINSNKNMDSKVDYIVILIVMIGIINLCLALWGGYELWNNSCDDLTDSNLWIFGFVTFISEVIVSFICIVIPPVLLIYFSIKECYYN